MAAGRPQQTEADPSAQPAAQGASPGATAKASALTSAKTSPVMRQYLEIKSDHEDAILFFRLGDFYEMFFEDAETASKILDIALTSRNKSDEHPIPMCGIPYHSARNYVARLLEAGVKVAICEQVELPRRGIARRQVARVVTPGTSLDEETLAPERGNYIACLVRTAGGWAMSRADFSTGELCVTELAGWAALEDELEGLAPSELLVEAVAREKQGGQEASEPALELERLHQLLPSCLVTERALRADKDVSAPTASLLDSGEMPAACRDALRVLLIYLDETQGGRTGHLREPELYEAAGFLKIDRATRRNLEIVESVEGGRRGSLLGGVDGSVTPMGKRLVRGWLLKPLADIGAIGDRLDAVELFVQDSSLAADLREALRGVGDLERLGGRLGSGAAGARDLLRLGDALDAVENTRTLFADKRPEGLVGRAVRGLDTLEEVRDLVRRAIAEEPPLSVGKGATIGDGYHEEVDRLRAISTDGKGWMTSFEAAERERSGIRKLKVGYNKVFGYYIEVSRAAQDRVPEEYERKQTLANAERYITSELKRREADLLGAEERLSSLESHLLAEVISEVAAHVPALARTASSLALLDALAGLADTAYRAGYVRPDMCKDGPLEIVEGRHPVVESALGSRFVPNDCVLGGDGDRVMVITGPNMAGKSTYLRQVALVALLAHCGSFVPATSARVPLVDRIFTRIGASDNLARGQSTFMVEMTETATILSTMTDRSLVVLDEIGRGTSTFDGISIAWAVAEAMVRAGVKTLFATHYHELAGLAAEHDCVGNYSVAVRRYKGDIVFLYRVVEGATSGSYGIEVARLAGVPEAVIEDARKMLARFESNPGPAAPEQEQQPSLFGPPPSAPPEPVPSAASDVSTGAENAYGELVERLADVDVDSLTPLKALNLLAELSRAAREGGSC